jgi:surfeit locus 1 family protein
VSARRGLLIPAAITLCGLAVLIALGTWQLERKAWKADLIANLTQRAAAPPVPLPPPQSWDRLDREQMEFTRVRVHADFTGEGDELVYTSGSVLRDDVKAPGYFVFSAGRLPDGRQVVVNRGYTRDKSYPVRTGIEEIVGYLRWPEPPSWFVPPGRDTSGVWHVRDHRAMANLRGWDNVAPFYVEQESPVPPGGVPHPAALHPKLPDNHLQYALTWYVLAVVLAAVFAVWAIQRRRQSDQPDGSVL